MSDSARSLFCKNTWGEVTDRQSWFPILFLCSRCKRKSPRPSPRKSNLVTSPCFWRSSMSCGRSIQRAHLLMHWKLKRRRRHRIRTRRIPSLSPNHSTREGATKCWHWNFLLVSFSFWWNAFLYSYTLLYRIFINKMMWKFHLLKNLPSVIASCDVVFFAGVAKSSKLRTRYIILAFGTFCW